MSTRLSAKERRRVFARLVERDGAACVHCGVPHRVIWRNAAAGGSNALSNLRLMCGDCHKQKTAADRRTPA